MAVNPIGNDAGGFQVLHGIGDKFVKIGPQLLLHPVPLTGKGNPADVQFVINDLYRQRIGVIQRGIIDEPGDEMYLLYLWMTGKIFSKFINIAGLPAIICIPADFQAAGFDQPMNVNNGYA